MCSSDLFPSHDSAGEAIAIGRKTYKTIKQNIAISILYNAVTIPLAMAGFVIPLVAAISMSFSSILVVLNSTKIKSDIKNG